MTFVHKNDYCYLPKARLLAIIADEMQRFEWLEILDELVAEDPERFVSGDGYVGSWSLHILRCAVEAHIWQNENSVNPDKLGN